MNKTIAVIRGDGIGPEIVGETLGVLDAVAASAFRMARGKAADLISAGRVQVNWRECTKGDKLLSEGDTVSARGFGKFELTEVGGVTRKGRISISIKRYV